MTTKSAPLSQKQKSRIWLRLTSNEKGLVEKLLLWLPFAILFALTAVPLIASIVISLLDWNLTTSERIRFNGISNYVAIAKDSNFWGAVGRTAYQVGATVAGQMVLGLAIAVLLARSFKGVGVLRSLYILPMMMTPVVAGLLWRVLFDSDRGMINYLLGNLGLEGPSWLADPDWAMPAVIIADLWLSTPFVVVVLLAGMLAIPEEIYEAARLDGASSWSILLHITIPLIRPMIYVALLFRLMDAMRRFDSIYVMTGGGPGNATETLELHGYFAAFEFLEMGRGAAIATVLLVLIFSLSMLILRSVEKEK